jgi:DNA modification methylase
MELNRIHNCTAIDLLTSLDEKAALIVADPPYGIGYKSDYKTVQGAKDGPRPDTLRDDMEFFDDDTIDPSWLTPAFSALKDGGGMYLFTRWDVLHHWQAAAVAAGFRVAQCIVWDKCLWGMGDTELYGSQTEFILFCVKGKHQLRWEKREGNVWRIARGLTLSRDGGGRHPTQKPTDLFKKIITYSSDVGDLVVDPFTGSGAACLAAQKLGRRWAGCDISPAFAAAAQAWIEKESPHTVLMF